VLSGGKKRVYGKGLAQFLPNDASVLAKNIACVHTCPFLRARPSPASLSLTKAPARRCQLPLRVQHRDDEPDREQGEGVPRRARPRVL